MIDSSLSSALFSAVAAAVSALTLWFTRLKGPDIELVDISEEQVGVSELRQQQFSERAPSSLDIEPIELLFTNSGSRSGIIREVMADFEPSLEFRSFFKEFRSNIKWESESSQAPQYGLPVSIREGDSRVITVDCQVGLIDWRYDWEGLNIANFPSPRELRRMVDDALDANRKKLGDFIDFLQSGGSFGTLKFSLTYTSRRRWFWIKLRTKDLATPMKVINSLKTTIEGYQDCLENWSSKQSGLLTKLDQLPQAPDVMINPLKAISEGLSREINEETISTIPSLTPVLKSLNTGKTLRNCVILREEELMDHLRFLSRRIDDYNKHAGAAKGSPNPERLVDLKREKSSLLEQARKALKELKSLKETLAEEFFPIHDYED